MPGWDARADRLGPSAPQSARGGVVAVTSRRRRDDGRKERTGRAPRFEPPPDTLILGAVERAERHDAGKVGVTFRAVMEHLGFVHSAATTRRLRPHFERLLADGLLASARRRGVVVWSLTRAGRSRLAQARRRGTRGELPESPQHRAWREAREAAEQRIDKFRDELRAALRDGWLVLNAAERADSDTWFVLGDRVARACWLVGSATHCLYEWREPDDARPDVDDHEEPDDDVLEQRERVCRRQLRVGRRGVWRWDSARTG